MRRREKRFEWSMLLAETVEGWRRSRWWPAQPCWARLGLASQRAISVWHIVIHFCLTEFLLEYEYFEYYIIVYYSSCLCYYSESDILDSFDLLALKWGRVNNILDISADHVRVKFRCDDCMTCASNTNCVEWNRRGLSSHCFWYCLLGISWTTLACQVYRNLVFTASQP